MTALLQVQDLQLEFKTARGILKALSGITFDVNSREVFGLVGETGCGKTVTGLSILRLLPKSARITNGSLIFNDKDLLRLPAKEMEALRGGDIAMIFQDPSSSLNPVFTIGSQMERVIRLHTQMNAKDAKNHLHLSPCAFSLILSYIPQNAHGRSDFHRAPIWMQSCLVYLLQLENS